jgi:hypothetical protein
MTDPKVHANPSNYARFYFHELFPKYVARGPQARCFVSRGSESGVLPPLNFPFRLSTAVYMDPDTIMLGNVAELGTILDHQVRTWILPIRSFNMHHHRLPFA